MNGVLFKADWAKSREVFELDGPMARLFKLKVDVGGIKDWRRQRDSAVADLTHDILKNVLQATRSQTGIDGTGNFSHKL
jgi:hypothetical protein